MRWFYLCTVREYFKASSSYWCVSFWMEKRKYCSHSQKTATNKILKIIDQFLYFRFVVKYLKDLFLTKCLSISPLTNSPRKTSPVSNPVIPVSTNCYRLPTKFLHLLIMDVRSVFLDISKAFDKVWHEGLIFKLKKNGVSDELFTSCPIFKAIGNKGLCLIVKIRYGPMFMLEFHKDLF